MPGVRDPFRRLTLMPRQARRAALPPGRPALAGLGPPWPARPCWRPAPRAPRATRPGGHPRGTHLRRDQRGHRPLRAAGDPGRRARRRPGGGAHPERRRRVRERHPAGGAAHRAGSACRWSSSSPRRGPGHRGRALRAPGGGRRRHGPGHERRARPPPGASGRRPARRGGHRRRLRRRSGPDRGRDARWVQGAILDGATLPASEALRRNVVDEVASDVPDLLSKIDGRRVSGPWGTRALATRGAAGGGGPAGLAGAPAGVSWSTPTWPTCSWCWGSTGCITEIAAPGVTVPGVAGGIALVLALFAFANLPVNWVGIVLILVAAGLFLAETQVASHGLFTLAGLVAFIAGSVLLFRPPDGVPSPYGAAGDPQPLAGDSCSAWAPAPDSGGSCARAWPPAPAPRQRHAAGRGDGDRGARWWTPRGRCSSGGQTWSAEWARRDHHARPARARRRAQGPQADRGAGGRRPAAVRAGSAGSRQGERVSLALG